MVWGAGQFVVKTARVYRVNKCVMFKLHFSVGKLIHNRMPTRKKVNHVLGDINSYQIKVFNL